MLIFDPIRFRFGADAQELFFVWLGELERELRDPNALQAPMVAHLAKFRGLMPKLAGLFALADRVAGDQELNEGVTITLDHARQAAAFCEYLKSHARRVYSCVISPELRAARELARHIEKGDLSTSQRAPRRESLEALFTVVLASCQTLSRKLSARGARPSELTTAPQ